VFCRQAPNWHSPLLYPTCLRFLCSRYFWKAALNTACSFGGNFGGGPEQIRFESHSRHSTGVSLRRAGRRANDSAARPRNAVPAELSRRLTDDIRRRGFVPAPGTAGGACAPIGCRPGRSGTSANEPVASVARRRRRKSEEEKVPMTADNVYRARAWECLSLAESMNDPEERAETIRFARMWMSLAEPIDEERGAYEFPH